MDSLTHALLGGTIAQAVYGKRLSSAVKWIGALSAMLPDVDVFYHSTPFDHFKYHRGYTHAFLFDVIAGILLGTVVWWLIKKRSSTNPPNKLKDCIGLFVIVLLSHPFLDLFTSYGTQVFLPFSENRYAFDVIAAIDPGYTVILLTGLVAGCFTRRWSQICAQVGLGLSALYLVYCGFLNQQATTLASTQLNEGGRQGFLVKSYPTLFQPSLRQVVARKADTLMVGFLSLWSPQQIQWDEVRDERNNPEANDLEIGRASCRERV